MCCKHHLIQAKETSALLSPDCSIPVRAFLSCGTSPFVIEVYIIEEVISLVFGHVTTITASDNRYGG